MSTQNLGGLIQNCLNVYCEIWIFCVNCGAIKADNKTRLSTTSWLSADHSAKY